MVPPLISVFRSNMLSPPKDAYPLVFAISYRVCLRWLLHIELCHDFTHNSDKKISIIDKLLQISMATKYELVNDCVKVFFRNFKKASLLDGALKGKSSSRSFLRQIFFTEINRQLFFTELLKANLLYGAPKGKSSSWSFERQIFFTEL